MGNNVAISDSGFFKIFLKSFLYIHIYNFCKFQIKRVFLFLSGVGRRINGVTQHPFVVTIRKLWLFISSAIIFQAVAVGYTPLTNTSKFYNIWYYVALKAREYDSIGEICFAAVTSLELAAELGIQTVPNARLILWNSTRVCY